MDKLTKPDLGSFNLILNKMKVSPEQTVFIDDNKKNIAVAKSLGINSILFEDNKQLKEEFIKLKIN